MMSNFAASIGEGEIQEESPERLTMVIDITNVNQSLTKAVKPSVKYCV